MWQLIVITLLIVGLFGIIWYDTNERRRLKQICLRYAGVPSLKWESLVPSRKIDAMRDEMNVLSKRANTILRELERVRLKPPELLQDAEMEFRTFFDVVEHRQRDFQSRWRARWVIYAVGLYCRMRTTPFKDPDPKQFVLRKVSTWQRDAEEWYRVVDRIGREVAKDLDAELRRFGGSG